jgi:hypothetical protein
VIDSRLSLLYALPLILWADAARAVAILHGDIVAITSTDAGLTGGAGSLVHIDPVSGAQSVISAGEYVDVGLTHDGRIFAVTASELVEVDPGTGDLRLVRDLTDLGSAMGLAVGPTGALFVAYEDAATRLSGIETIDPVSGAGSNLSPLGTFGRVGDLEFIPGGNLAALAEKPGGDYGELNVAILDSLGGVSAIPGSVMVAVQGGGSGAAGGALGVSPSGDLVAMIAYGWQGSQAKALVVATGDSINLDVPTYFNDDGVCQDFCSDGEYLLRSDVAYQTSGEILVSVNGFSNSPPQALSLFRVATDGTFQIVTDGAFSEVQVMVPEPSTALLLLAGLLGLAMASGRRPA